MRAVFATALLAFCAVVRPLEAQLLFSTGGGPDVTFRADDSGPGQRVAVGTTSQLTQFGFWVGTFDEPTSLAFSIWDATGVTRLFQSVKTVTSGSAALVLTDPFAFILQGGQSYHFAVTGDGFFEVGYFSTPFTLSQNGISLLNPNSNFGPYSAPIRQDDGGATIALELRGTVLREVPSNVVPEPGTVVLFASGLIALVVLQRTARRGRRSNA